MHISTIVIGSISMMLGIVGANANPIVVVRSAEVTIASGLPAAKTSGNVAASGLPV
ncbi:hypothetical protein F4604DRAFT_1936184 [Suillus subluteus]|nr:hypothetical protein F4604DRAFT_1936184 [Suillus subluteus]